MACISSCLRNQSLTAALAALLVSIGLTGCSDGCLSTSDSCSGLEDEDEVDVSPGSSSSSSNDEGVEETTTTDGEEDATTGEAGDTTNVDDGTSEDTDTTNDETMTNDDASTQDDAELTCDAEADDLSSCDVCVRGSCCPELLECSNSIDCSGAGTDGIATGEFGCIEDFIAEAEVNDGFVDLITLEDAKEACRAGDAISPETEALLGCMLAEASPIDGEPCASACLGIIQ